MANEKSILDDLLALLSPEEQVAVKAKLAANPQLVAQDKFVHSLFGAYKGFEEVVEPVTPVVPAVHTPAVPVVASAAPVVPAVVPAAAAPSSDNKDILAMLTGINERLKNVVTADQIPKLGADLVNSAIAHSLRQSDELAVIRETHREEFGEKLDKAAFEKFVTDAQDATTHRSPYATLTDAYNAMVSEKRVAKKIADGVADGIKQKTSGTLVPGQTQTVALSPAQQAIAKAKAAGNGGGKSNLDAAIERLRSLNSDSAAVQ